MQGKSTSKSTKISKLVIAICELAIGIVLFIHPVSFTTAIITILGILVFIAGILCVFHYFKASPAEAARGNDLTQGLLEVSAGLFCIFKSNWFIVTFPLLTVLYGVIMLIGGISKIQWTVDLLRMNADKWFWAAISAVITIICSGVILCNPFTSTEVLWTFIAVTLIVEAAADVLVVIFAKDKISE